MSTHWHAKKLVSGLIFLCVGMFAAIHARNYGFGEMTRLGAGAFPMVLGVLLASIGLASIVSSRFASEGESLRLWEGKAMILIPLSVVIFGLMVERLGLVPAIVASAFVAGLSNPTVRYVELAILALGTALFGAALFVYGLGLPFPLFVGGW